MTIPVKIAKMKKTIVKMKMKILEIIQNIFKKYNSKRMKIKVMK